MSDLRFPFTPDENSLAIQRPADLVKRIAAAVLVTGLFAMLVIAQRSPDSPPRPEVRPSVTEQPIGAGSAVKTSDTAVAIDVVELRHQQLAIHG